MSKFNTSLLREKFVITDPSSKTGEPVVALSNRMVVALSSSNGKYTETYVVRAHNMQLCIRMAAKIFHVFEQNGPLQNRTNGFNWEEAWKSTVSDYERIYNDQRWGAIYFKGKAVFSTGDQHGLLDVIEQCDFNNDGQYDDAVPMAEVVFKKAGKTVNISHDTNVALVADFEKTQGRIGIILRASDRTTTFSFTISESEGDLPLNIAQCLTTAAAFLEAIQMTFMIGMGNYKCELGIFARHSKEEKQNREAKKRLARLSGEIENLEVTYEVHYRPERPSLKELMNEAEELAHRTIEPPAKKGILEQEEDNRDAAFDGSASEGEKFTQNALDILLNKDLPPD